MPPTRRMLPATWLLTLAAMVGLVLGGTTGLGAPTTPPVTAASSAWPDDAVVYHVFLDRFADGDAVAAQVAGEPRPAGPVTAGPDPAAIPGDPDAPGYADALTDWMGGDLVGLAARLDHVVDLGANTLWLSPVSPGPYHHGYHPTDLTDVDPRFGDVEVLRQLVADAHARGLRVLYDLVLNHTSDRHPWFVAAQDDCAGSPFVAYYRFRECPERYAAFANLPELPQLDLDHPPLRRYLADEVLPFWLDDIGVDGFRLDHVEGPSRDAWRFLRSELDARWPGTLLLGEVWASQPIIDSYADVLDAATAFPLRDRLAVVLARGGDVRAVAQPVAALVGSLASDGTPRPATYLSSHDQPRFTFEAGGDTRRTALAYTAILTLPGLPVVYAGDEVGVSQHGSLPAGADFADRWFREPMVWDVAAWDAALHTRVQAAARLRTTSASLQHDLGYHEVLGEGEVWAYERWSADDTQRVLVVLNTADEPTTLTAADLPLRRPLPAGVAPTLLLGADDALTVDDAAGFALSLAALDAVVLELPG